MASFPTLRLSKAKASLMAASAERMDLTTSAVEGWMAPPFMAIQKGENRGFIELLNHTVGFGPGSSSMV